jgi:hypothetical protein
MSISPFKRILSPVYNDGISEPRIKSVTGKLLPNPRSIALIVHSQHTKTSNLANSFVFFR